MRLKRVTEPFDRPEYLSEIKLNGWRALALCEGTATRLLSRHGNRLRFDALTAEISRTLGGCAVLDGEVVCLDGNGKPQFYELRHRSAEPFYLAFDLLWLDGRDLRNVPLVQAQGRARRHRQRRRPRPLCAARRAARRREGGREAAARVYVCGGRNDSSWFKIKNAHYSHAEGRREWFEGRRAAPLPSRW